MMMVVVERVMLDAPPTSDGSTAVAASAARAASVADKSSMAASRPPMSIPALVATVRTSGRARNVRTTARSFF